MTNRTPISTPVNMTANIIIVLPILIDMIITSFMGRLVNTLEHSTKSSDYCLSCLACF
jgi:hypothetical protein